jgi:hypothetical protein
MDGFGIRENCVALPSEQGASDRATVNRTIDIQHVKKRIISGALPIRAVPEYEAVMAAYRAHGGKCGIPDDVKRLIELRAPKTTLPIGAL